MVNKIKAVMLGHAVGDALGVPVEFSSREELDNAPVTDMEGFGTYPYPAGTWSDDTSMSLAALDVLKSGEIQWGEIMLNFVKWFQYDEYTATGETFDVGNTCAKAITKYITSGLKPAECGETDGRSNGNGSLMRIHPFVLYATLTLLKGSEEGHWLWLACIEKASSLTHAHARSVMGCYIYGYCLSFLLKESTKESLVAGIKFAEGELDYLPEFKHYKRIFDKNFADLKREEIKSTGYVVDTLEAALWCLLNTNSYEECVLTAVNLGNDTDTVAAVAGSLAGALYGYDSIPEKWLNTLKKREYIEEMCETAGKNWIK